MQPWECVLTMRVLLMFTLRVSMQPSWKSSNLELSDIFLLHKSNLSQSSLKVKPGYNTTTSLKVLSKQNQVTTRQYLSKFSQSKTRVQSSLKAKPGHNTLSKFSQSKTRSQHDNLSQKKWSQHDNLSQSSLTVNQLQPNTSRLSLGCDRLFSSLRSTIPWRSVRFKVGTLHELVNTVIYCTSNSPCSKFKSSGGHVLGKHDACGRASFGRSLARRSGRHCGICEHVLAHELAPVVAGKLLVGFPHQVLPAWKHAAAPSGWSGSALPAPARWWTTAETAARGSGSSAGSSPWAHVQATVHNYTKGFEIDMRKMLPVNHLFPLSKIPQSSLKVWHNVFPHGYLKVLSKH